MYNCTKLPTCYSLSLSLSLLPLQREVDSAVAVLQDKNTELESLLEYLRSQPDDINIDEAVMATTPLYEQ